MHKNLLSFADRLLPRLRDPAAPMSNSDFNRAALELFAIQFENVSVYRKFCQARGTTPANVEHWTGIPAVPTSAFKEFELTSLAPEEQVTVFHSSGTTAQIPSRHFHCAESLRLYEASLWPWFLQNCRIDPARVQLICLTPPPSQAPRSSLVHMFGTIRQKLDAPESAFVGEMAQDGTWSLNFDDTLRALNEKPRTQSQKLILGTAFSFVHLVDFFTDEKCGVTLPPGSVVMETGGYKNRSRSLPKAELHALISDRLGILPDNILCEYGMSELSSQAYDRMTDRECGMTRSNSESRHFTFPPWARARVISPESGHEIEEGETGLLCIFDLANVFSVMAVQTEDLAVRRGAGFELIGRAALAEARGCSLMAT